MVSGRVWGHRARQRGPSESREDESSERPAAEVRPNDEPRPGDHVDRRRKLHRARQRPDRRERPQRRLLGRDGSVVHDGQPDADDRRRPPVRRRARRHRQPMGRDRRTERHRARPRRELHVLVRALVERRQQERGRALVGLSVDPFDAYFTANELLTTDDHVVEQHVRAVDVDRPRAGRVPDRRLARPLDVLRRQRLTRRRWRERPQRRLLGRDRSVVHDGQPDADDRRRPPVRRRARRNRQPVGRDRRTERHRPRPRRDLPLLVRHLVERRRQERASTRRVVGRPVRRLLHRQRDCSRPTTTSSSNTFEQSTSTDLGQVAFQIGGSPDPWTFCVDNVSLAGGAAPEPYVPDTGPRVRVNQVGYLPHGRRARRSSPSDRAAGVGAEERVRASRAGRAPRVRRGSTSRPG